MISKKLHNELNQQINEELFSAYLYLSMSAHFRAVNLDGFAAWMEVQAHEELNHAMKFFHYLDERNQIPALLPVKGPQTGWKSPLAAFEAAYKHEQHITSRIHTLLRLANAEEDFATANFLQWFVKEQVEEEKSAADVVARLKMVKENVGGLLILDKELGSRKAG
jgi:ferritin